VTTPAAILSNYARRQREDARLGVGAEDRSEQRRQARIGEVEAQAVDYFRAPERAPKGMGEAYFVAVLCSYGLSREDAQSAVNDCAHTAALERHCEAVPMTVRLADLLHREDISTWETSRLRVWARDLPCLLLAALTITGDVPDQTGIPRDKGPYTEADLHGVLHYGVLAELEASAEAWRALGRWALTQLYPEYRRRTGKAHACEARVWWCGTTHKQTAINTLGYRA
jgi:hypothetical protein